MKRTILLIIALFVVFCAVALAQGRTPSTYRGRPWSQFLSLGSAGSVAGGGGVAKGTVGRIPYYKTVDSILEASLIDIDGSGNIDMNSLRITNLGFSASTDAISKGYVDSYFVHRDTAAWVDESGVPSEGFAVFNDVGTKLTATTLLQISPALVAGSDLSMDGNEITSLGAGTSATSAVTQGQVSDTLDADQRPVAFDRLADPTGNTSINLGSSNVAFTAANPTAGWDFNVQGAFTGHFFEITQSVGNPGAGTHLVHVDADDPDVVGLHVSHASATATNLLVTGGKSVVTPTEGTTITNTNAALTVGQPADTGGVEVFGDVIIHGDISAENFTGGGGGTQFDTTAFSTNDSGIVKPFTDPDHNWLSPAMPGYTTRFGEKWFTAVANGQRIYEWFVRADSVNGVFIRSVVLEIKSIRVGNFLYTQDRYVWEPNNVSSFTDAAPSGGVGGGAALDYGGTPALYQPLLSRIPGDKWWRFRGTAISAATGRTVITVRVSFEIPNDNNSSYYVEITDF